MTQFPIDKLRSYVYAYTHAHVIDNGFCEWLVTGTKDEYARIARKAIMLGMKVRYDKDKVEDVYNSLQVYY